MDFTPGIFEILITCFIGRPRSPDELLVFFSSRRRHTILTCDWSSDVCSSDLGGGLLARRGAGRCDAASRVGVPPSRLARIAPRPHRGAKGWAVLLRPDDRERGPRPLGSRPGAVARVARDGDAGTGPDVSVPVPASPFPVVQPHPSPSERPRLI